MSHCEPRGLAREGRWARGARMRRTLVRCTPRSEHTARSQRSGLPTQPGRAVHLRHPLPDLGQRPAQRTGSPSPRANATWSLSVTTRSRTSWRPSPSPERSGPHPRRDPAPGRGGAPGRERGTPAGGSIPRDTSLPADLRRRACDQAALTRGARLSLERSRRGENPRAGATSPRGTPPARTCRAHARAPTACSRRRAREC